MHEHLSARWSHLYNAVLSAGTSPHLRVLAVALAVDGLSSLVEGWAVWRRRPWAPWLIVVTTGGLVPLEVALILERPTAARFAILAVNVATVAYMVHSRMRARPASPGARAPPPARAADGAGAGGPWASSSAYVGLAYLALPWLLEHRERPAR